MAATTERPEIARMGPRHRALDLFWLVGAPVGVVALLFALGAHL